MSETIRNYLCQTNIEWHMGKRKYVFSQLLDYLNLNQFDRIVERYCGNKYVKTFSCRNQFSVMVFGQLCGRESLRDLILATQAHASKAYHLGFGKHPTRSNLSKANATRDWHIFEEFAMRTIEAAKECRATEIFRLGGNVYAFDSTTVDLCLNVFKWALFRKNKGGIKVHTLFDVETQIPTFFHITDAKTSDMKAMDYIPYEPDSFYIFDRGYNDFARLYHIEEVEAYFVVRGKKNNDFMALKWKRRFPKDSGLLSDAIGYMYGEQTRSRYPDKIRRIKYLDIETGKTFIFFTNALDINALTVALLYKNRWQIELFFKWLKQHLRIKKFWGESENAVRIQIYTAIVAYCMMAMVQKWLGVERSIYEMLQIVSVSLTDTTELKDLFAKPDFNVDMEPNDEEEDIREPTLFDEIS